MPQVSTELGIKYDPKAHKPQDFCHFMPFFILGTVSASQLAPPPWACGPADAAKNAKHKNYNLI